MNPHPNSVLAAVPSEEKPSSSKTGMAAVDQAFEALQAYQYGSSRAALAPLDEALRHSLEDETARKQWEQKLAGLLSSQLSAVAKEYICSKLLLVGSLQSIPAMAELLLDPALAQAACNVLETMAYPEAGQALCRQLPKLAGLPKVAVINSLGKRRETNSVPLLAELLKNSDQQVVSAAAAALGQIGTVDVAQVLLKFQPDAPVAIRGAVADACLVCAEHLSVGGHRTEAQSLYQALTKVPQSSQVRAAAENGLRAIKRPL
jgi:HEAT repeat protein